MSNQQQPQYAEKHQKPCKSEVFELLEVVRNDVVQQKREAKAAAQNILGWKFLSDFFTTNGSFFTKKGFESPLCAPSR
jgi:hypothetical protein